MCEAITDCAHCVRLGFQFAMFGSAWVCLPPEKEITLDASIILPNSEKMCPNRGFIDGFDLSPFLQSLTQVSNQMGKFFTNFVCFVCVCFVLYCFFQLN